MRASVVAKLSGRGTVRKRTRRGSSAMLVAIIAASAAAGTAMPAGARPSKRSPMAHAAHTLNATDTGKLHLVRSSGSLLYEEGSASGGLPGHMKADMDVGATFTGGFTIYTSDGTVKGHGAATPRGSGR